MLVLFIYACKLSLNIGAVATIGDSVAGGCGARGIVYNPVANIKNYDHNRGVSAITGADNDALSLYTIAARHSNGTLEGASFGTRLNNFCRGAICVWPINRFEKDDGLNMAQSGAFASNAMRQAVELVKRILAKVKQNPGLQTQWKLVNLWLGLNDQCEHCVRDDSRPMRYRYYLEKVLEYLRKSLNFVIVNLISLWNVKEVLDLGKTSAYCQRRNIGFRVVCRCANNDIRSYQIAQNQALEDISLSYRGQNMADFKVLYDPSSSGTNITALNLSALTKTDCMHPSKAAHGQLASLFWYNLFQNSKKKLRDQYSAFNSSSLEVECPNTIKFD